MRDGYTTDPKALAQFICDRYDPKVMIGCTIYRVDVSVIEHHIRDGVPVDYQGKGESNYQSAKVFEYGG